MGRTRAAAVIMLVVGLAGCGDAADSVSATDATDEPEVVSHTGLAEIELGDDRTDLERDHGLVQGAGDCAPRLPAYPSASPVFEDDQLVLLWADPPLRTPAGLAVGSAVDEVRDAHPEAEELRAPPDSHRFDGLLAAVDHRAYLFLHDQREVQKLVVGYEEHARRLFQEDFGAC